ncbi:MAG TPA: hypothetical protein VN840_07435 [Streptosporangiaceae bacterium]|nr:hypothetical protein [Streptosporangiaceae bacterium]
MTQASGYDNDAQPPQGGPDARTADAEGPAPEESFVVELLTDFKEGEGYLDLLDIWTY